METGAILIFVLVGVVVVGVIIAAIFFNRKAVIRRKLKKIPPRSLNEILSDDIVRISGAIELLGDVKTAPLSGRQCAYYHVEVEQHKSSGKNSRWVTIINEEICGDIVIRDGRYYAIISKCPLKVYAVQDGKFNSGFLNDATPQLNTYLQSKGVNSVSWIGLNKSLRYKEGVFESGEKLTVAGKARWITKSDTHLDLPTDRILLIEPLEDGKVYVTDDNLV